MEQKTVRSPHDLWHTLSPSVQIQHLQQVMAQDLSEHGLQMPLCLEAANERHGDTAKK